MNIEYLRYALEVSKCKSMNKAASNLFFSQPNLLRCINSLEEEVGYKIFKRSKSGVETTLQGEDFLRRAEVIVREYNFIKNINVSQDNTVVFSIACPKGAYISHATQKIIRSIDKTKNIQIDFKETSSYGAFEEIVHNNINLGIMRVSNDMEDFISTTLDEYHLNHKIVKRFSYMVAFSKNDPLASKDKITKDDLADYIEITHGDPYIPKVSTPQKDKTEAKRIIRAYDSMGQLKMLSDVDRAFMVVYPLNEDTLEKYGLVQYEVDGISKAMFDILIYKNSYYLSPIDKMFLGELEQND
ncbi:MAG: LysR family transcriptional regulator [Bacilli bacterium]|nr:LysR family transcriptional regulator [Bacilli bacterium]